MRNGFSGELGLLTGQLAELARLTVQSMSDANAGLLEVDLARAERAIAAERNIAALHGDCEGRALSMLALQSPVATDLRMLFSAIRISADLARMGGQARHVAEAVRRRFPDSVVPPETRGQFLEMGVLATAMADRARHALIEPDLQLLSRLRTDDDRMDELHAQLTALITGESWPHGVISAVDLTLLAGFYERFADHAVNVAERIVFLVTGARPPAARTLAPSASITGAAPAGAETMRYA
ncbi:phosphate signaling complex protein PhoU [Rhodococcus daqingensis]|uniref:Phosphate signaling complex protein PhoU n=1 Tax=Rhodococcus daqingensis TaxID=2479363 RepID=A0ABW2S3R6_9NOCA